MLTEGKLHPSGPQGGIAFSFGDYSKKGSISLLIHLRGTVRESVSALILGDHSREASINLPTVCVEIRKKYNRI